MISPTDLQNIIRNGLLSFPVTPFDAQDNFAKAPFQAHLDWLSQYKVAGLIVAGGTGEMFSLAPDRRPAGGRREPGARGLSGHQYGGDFLQSRAIAHLG